MTNLYAHDTSTSQTDRRTDGRTTYDSNTALALYVHRAVKIMREKYLDWSQSKSFLVYICSATGCELNLCICVCFFCQRSRAGRVSWTVRLTRTATSFNRTAVSSAPARTASTPVRHSVRRNCVHRRRSTASTLSWSPSRTTAAASGSVHTRTASRDPTTNTTSAQVCSTRADICVDR